MPRRKYVTRVTVSEDYRPRYEEILKETGIKNGSQLLAIFINVYGDALIQKMRGY
jgi:hypothetical protein